MSNRKRQKLGYLLGIVFSLSVLLVLFLPSSQTFLRNGPMIVGHEKLECFSCHQDEQGNFRQQLQANIQYLLNNRKEVVSVGLKPVGNNECIKCHERPNDRHPVYRFREPKYRKATEKIKADTCIACHLEHKSKRITVTMSYCMHCHDTLTLEEDPTDISHQQLIEDNNWSSCLTCHDYHGNHNMKTETETKKAIAVSELKKYFDRAPNPYPGKIIHKAKNEEK